MHRLRHITSWIAFAFITGCLSDNDYGEVSGTVTYDNRPVEDGAITFIPLDGKGPTTGGTIKDGKYAVARVPVGTMKVSISGSKVVGKKKLYNAPNSPEGLITQEYLPEKYNLKTELTFEVKRGVNSKDWHLPK